MKTKEEHNQIREDLILGTIVTVSKYGLEGLTTKQIASVIPHNEAYIYRYFQDKDDLLVKTFNYVDGRICELLKKTLEHCESEKNLYDICRKCFDLCWEHVITKPERSIFYVRFYNSTLFTKEVQEEHIRTFSQLFNMLKKYQKGTFDFDIVLHGIYVIILSFAIDIALNKYDNTKENNDKIFEFIYKIIQEYFTV